VRVVGDQQQRPPLGEVGDEPVEGVRRGEPGHRHRAGGTVEPERGGGGRRGTAEQAVALVERRRAQEGLEELGREAVREVALEIGSARAQHVEPAVAGHLPGGAEQRGLPDPGRALQYEQRPGAVGRRVEGGGHLAELGLPLDDRPCHICDPRAH
jgi:hypothetical protein